MIKREAYLKKIRPFYESDLIKVITGIRRCGKSVVLEQIQEELSEKTDNIIFLNFERNTVRRELPDEEKLIQYVMSHKREGKCYLFLDEAQMIDNWNLACKSLRLENISIFITGSNSKLLSGEFTKELSGRYVSFRIRPFVYKEIIEYGKELNKEISIMDYLSYGGFPLSLAQDNYESKITYLEDLNETIVINDIIRRYNIRKTELFRQFVDYVCVSNARIFSSSSIVNYLKNEKMNLTVSTIAKFLSYLKEAYVIETVEQYDTKTKKKLKYFQKIYLEDISFNTIRQQNNRIDLTHNFENIIYNELLFMGYKVTVYRVREYEIDFQAVKNNKIYLIQAAYSVVDEKAYEREFKPFSLLDNSAQKILITNDDLDYSTSTVKHIRLIDFLKMEDLDEV